MKNIIIISFALLFVGCAGKVKVTVDRMVGAIPPDQAKIYVEAQSADSDLQKAYYEKFVKDGLKRNDYVIVDDPKVADYFVFFRYRTDRSTVYKTTPIYQWNPPKSYDFATVNNRGTVTAGVISEQNGSNQIVGTQTTAKGRFNQVIEVVCIDKAKELEKLQNQKAVSTVWEMEISSMQKRDNFKTIFPQLITGGALRFKDPSSGRTAVDIRPPLKEN